MTGALRVEGRRVAIEDGDTIASAMYRDGVRTFTRSLKYHRRRGLSCLSGDCPNCLVTVDGQPGVRACVTPAREGQDVRRPSGWPSTEHDALHVTDRLHRLMPVAFYSKTFIRPRFAWPLAERVIRRATGIGRLPAASAGAEKPVRAVHVDVLVVGGGVAGLAAAAEAATAGATTLLVEEHALASGTWDVAARERIDALASEARAAGATILERHTAVGLYAGPFVPVVGPDEVLHVEAARVIAATGAVEIHGVFPGNDLPGVFLARGAARLAGVHGVAPGRRAVVVTSTEEGAAAAEILRAAGTEVAEVVQDAVVVRAEGSRRVEAVVIGSGADRRRIACDTLVLSLGWSPRDDLLRMGTADEVVGAGDVVLPGCSIEEAEASGRRAAGGARQADAPAPDIAMGDGGYVCLCEDVAVHDLGAGMATRAGAPRRSSSATRPPRWAHARARSAAGCSRRSSRHGRARRRRKEHAPPRARPRGPSPSRIWRPAWTRPSSGGPRCTPGCSSSARGWSDPVRGCARRRSATRPGRSARSGNAPA